MRRHDGRETYSLRERCALPHKANNRGTHRAVRLLPKTRRHRSSGGTARADGSGKGRTSDTRPPKRRIASPGRPARIDRAHASRQRMSTVYSRPSSRASIVTHAQRASPDSSVGHFPAVHRDRFAVERTGPEFQRTQIAPVRHAEHGPLAASPRIIDPIVDRGAVAAPDTQTAPHGHSSPGDDGASP